jgi:S-DNA-T family DNA segregation ATPase FtsK/SpoIIIE
MVLIEWLVKATGWGLRGMVRATRDFANYVDDRQGLQVADQTAGGIDGRADVEAWLRARAERHREVIDRRKVVRSRLAVPLAVLGVVLGTAVWLGERAILAAALRPLALVSSVAAWSWLVWYGRPRSAPFWPIFREPSPYPPLTADTVTAALTATGISQIKDLVKTGHSPVDVIYRNDTAGGKIAETCVIPGVTTDMLRAKAVIVAGALKRPTAMVHLSQAPSGVPGHVEILVLDIDPGKTKPKPFTYLGTPVNVGTPCTIGYDPRNAPVRWALPGRNTIATGTPKTASELRF